MTRRDGTGSIKEDGGQMANTRSRGGSVPPALHTALVRILYSSGLLKADHYSLQALV
jgi:hypothetical protein